MANIFDSILNTVNNAAATVSGQASELAPLAGTMSAALKNLGIQPPTELSELARVFHGTVVAPNTQVTGASPVNDIINYVGAIFKQKQAGQPLSSTQQIVANGAGEIIGGIKIGPMFFIVAGAIVLIIVLVLRK